MVYFVLLFLEIAILFLLSRKMSKELCKFMPVNFLSFLFLPGIIIHELSHLLMAVILFVQVGDMEFTPKISSNTLKLGSVEIGKTDPIRRSIIGFAPVFVGIALVLGLSHFIVNSDALPGIGIIALMFYLLFAVSNTMFSSRKDMEGTVEILITLLIIFAISYIIGFRPQLTFIENLFTKETIELVRKSTIFLLMPIIIDLAILGAVRVLTRRGSQT